MTIGWYTDNELSKTVLGSIPNIQLKHIKEFKEYCAVVSPDDKTPGVFYGLLRGASRLMHIYQHGAVDYYYIDNGYFDALYVDKSMHKSMEGKFRVVKNGMHEVYWGNRVELKHHLDNILIIPPSPYSANFYDTTPEDWLAGMKVEWSSDHRIKIRDKNRINQNLLEEDLDWCDIVISFNSMAVMKAIEMGKAVTDTHGIFRNKTICKYDIAELRAFYEPKQFTLEEFRSGKCKWN